MSGAYDHLPDMTALRAEVDRIDTALIALLAERAALIDRAVVLKQAEGLPARLEGRVAEVLENARRWAQARGLDPDLAERLWREIVEWSITREEETLGPD